MAEAAVGQPKGSPSREAASPDARALDVAAPSDATEAKPPLPPAASIFSVVSGMERGPRSGELLGLATPAFVLLTSRGLPLVLRPQHEQVPGFVRPHTQEGALYHLPVGDLLQPQQAVANCPNVSELGCRRFWPHLKDQKTYCAFRNPSHTLSVHGGDKLCSVETAGGRRKIGPRELLDTQRVMRADIVAAPAEEVPLDVSASRRLTRAVSRAADWLKEILEAKAQEPELNFDWHVLASIQGGNDVKLRQKACETAATMPVAGYWIGGLGYDETLQARQPILEAVASNLPSKLPRFLPLNVGTPLEVLQAVLLGVDVFEVPYPVQLAEQGIALTFSVHMPGVESSADPNAPVPAFLLPAKGKVVRQLQLGAPECREDFSPISKDSPVRQYSRAYLYHLREAREMLATILLAQHNLHVYTAFFAAVREHIRVGSLASFASWFAETQICDALPEVALGAKGRKRKRH